MSTCSNTFDGQHHYAPRKWLARDSDGRSMDPNVKDHWRTVLACVCGQECPPSLMAAVEAGLEETAAEREQQRVTLLRMADRRHPQMSMMEKLI